MSKVLIVSDSHGLTSELETLKERHQVSEYIHCGDSELTADAAPLNDYQVVKGNCDWQGDFQDELIVEKAGLRFFITHGHLFDVKTTLLKLQYRALEVNADIVCFGHSHIAYAEKIGEQLFINPGSILLPKHFNVPSYVIIEWEVPLEVNVTFYSLEGKEIATFPYNNKFTIKN